MPYLFFSFFFSFWNNKLSIVFKNIIKIHLIVCCVYIKIALCNILPCVPPASQLPASLSVSSEHGCFYSTNKRGPEISILMHCLFKRARGQEWRCYQPAIHHGHDTLSPPLPHLQAMLYRTNTSPPAVQSSIFLCYALELHEYPHTVPAARLWRDCKGFFSSAIWKWECQEVII